MIKYCKFCLMIMGFFYVCGAQPDSNKIAKQDYNCVAANSTSGNKTTIDDGVPFNGKIILGIFGLLISIATSVITVKLSIGKFRTEKWWEHQNSTYSDILVALHYLKRYYSESFDEELLQRSLPEKEKKELYQKWKEGYDRLSLEVDKGAFLISDEAYKILKNGLDNIVEQMDNPNWMSAYDENCGTIIKCLEDFRNQAKKDLKVDKLFNI